MNAILNIHQSLNGSALLLSSICRSNFWQNRSIEQLSSVSLYISFSRSRLNTLYLGGIEDVRRSQQDNMTLLSRMMDMIWCCWTVYLEPVEHHLAADIALSHLQWTPYLNKCNCSRHSPSLLIIPAQVQVGSME